MEVALAYAFGNGLDCVILRGVNGVSPGSFGMGVMLLASKRGTGCQTRVCILPKEDCYLQKVAILLRKASHQLKVSSVVITRLLVLHSILANVFRKQ